MRRGRRNLLTWSAAERLESEWLQNVPRRRAYPGDPLLPPSFGGSRRSTAEIAPLGAVLVAPATKDSTEGRFGRSTAGIAENSRERRIRTFNSAGAKAWARPKFAKLVNLMAAIIVATSRARKKLAQDSPAWSTLPPHLGPLTGAQNPQSRPGEKWAPDPWPLTPVTEAPGP